MKQNYKILDEKKCKGIKFRIVQDVGEYQWQYRIQYEFDSKMKRFKKLWIYQNHQDALDDFDCERMLKTVKWMENVE